MYLLNHIIVVYVASERAHVHLFKWSKTSRDTIPTIGSMKINLSREQEEHENS